MPPATPGRHFGRHARSGVAVLAALVAAGCGTQEPFPLVQVRGTVAYEDGTVIPAEPLVLTFYPQRPMLDPETHPRPGMALADPATGEIWDVSSHRASDGLVAGVHRVTLTTLERTPLPGDLLPAEYADPGTTPLEIDTAKLPFRLLVRRPPGGQRP